MRDVPSDNEGNAPIKKAWRDWLIMFAPLFALFFWATEWFGFGAAFPALVGLLIATLLYQRVINGRGWYSIMWGVHGRSE